MTQRAFSENGLTPTDPSGAWSAIADGALRVPPPEHVLDFLVRHYVVVDDDAYRFAELLNDSGPGTIALMDGEQLPGCDICERDSRGSVTARYDAQGDRSGAWAYLCGDCFVASSRDVLGIGYGQYLMRNDEIPDEVREAFWKARDYWIGRGAAVPEYSPFDDC